jgi:hypothetical protein
MTPVTPYLRQFSRRLELSSKLLFIIKSIVVVEVVVVVVVVGTKNFTKKVT